MIRSPFCFGLILKIEKRKVGVVFYAAGSARQCRQQPADGRGGRAGGEKERVSAPMAADKTPGIPFTFVMIVSICRNILS
jgi:hypothetical protein